MNNANSAPYKNTLLKRLRPDVVKRLNLKPVEFELEHEIEYPGKTIDHLFFLEEGMASMTTTFQDGSQVEVGMFGFESVIGISALMGSKRSLNRVYTQIAGHGFSSPVEAGRAEFCRGEQFQSLALRYVQAQLLLAAQSAGCNAKHELGQRLARWLLICSDRAHNNSFKMSHEYLGEMLGVTRPTISATAAIFKEKGILDYSRGQLHILDRAALEKNCCECYRVIKDHLDNYAEFDTGFVG